MLESACEISLNVEHFEAIRFNCHKTEHR